MQPRCPLLELPDELQATIVRYLLAQDQRLAVLQLRMSSRAAAAFGFQATTVVGLQQELLLPWTKQMLQQHEAELARVCVELRAELKLYRKQPVYDTDLLALKQTADRLEQSCSRISKVATRVNLTREVYGVHQAMLHRARKARVLIGILRSRES